MYAIFIALSIYVDCRPIFDVLAPLYPAERRDPQILASFSQVVCPKETYPVSFQHCASPPQSWYPIRGNCVKSNAYFAEDVGQCVFNETVEAILSCPPGYIIGWSKRKICKNKGRNYPLQWCDPPYVFDGINCERRLIKPGHIGCLPEEIQVNNTCLAAEHEKIIASCPENQTSDVKPNGKVYCIELRRYPGVFKNGGPSCLKPQDRIATIWKNGTKIYNPPLVECTQIIRHEAHATCRPGAMHYERYDDTIGNPYGSCVRISRFNMRPSCPYTDGKGYVVSLVSTLNRAFTEEVPGLEIISGRVKMNQEDGTKVTTTQPTTEQRTSNQTTTQSENKTAPNQQDMAAANPFIFGPERNPRWVGSDYTDELIKLVIELYESSKDWITFDLLEDPRLFVESMTPIPPDPWVLSNLWIQWLRRKLYIPICVEFDIRLPYVKCPQSFKFGADGTCKPMDEASLLTNCPPDFEVDLSGAAPVCVGRVDTPTNHWCDSLDHLVDLEHGVCLVGSNITEAEVSPSAKVFEDLYGRKGMLIFEGTQNFLEKRPSRNWYPFSGTLLPIRVFGDLLERTMKALRGSRIYVATVDQDGKNNSGQPILKDQKNDRPSGGLDPGKGLGPGSDAPRKRLDRSHEYYTEFFNEETFINWLALKREDQIQYLIAQTADLLRLGRSGPEEVERLRVIPAVAGAVDRFVRPKLLRWHENIITTNYGVSGAGELWPSVQ